MTLQEAIEEVRLYHMEMGDPDLDQLDIERSARHMGSAIATILNAVVKGELK